MKKLLLSLSIVVLGSVAANAQCVYTCSNYAVSEITYTTFPSGTLNVVPSFTNPFLGYTTDDGSTGPIPIGFSFDFFCTTYTDIWICSNGFITFTPVNWPTQFVHTTQSLPNSADPNAMVAFNMVDLDPTMGGTITYTTVGSSPNRMFVVTFSNVPTFGQSDLNTGQIVLYETSNIIEIHTKSAMYCSSQSPGSTQGIENATGSQGFVPPGRNANKVWNHLGAADNTAYQFAPYSTPPLGAVTGNTLLCEGTVGNYVVQTATGALSYNWTAPNGWTGTSTTSAISYTASASGAVSVTAQFTCGYTTPSTLAVNVLPAPVVAKPTITPGIVCTGNTIQITPSGAVVYTLQPGNGVGAGPFVYTPTGPVVFTVTGSDSAGCVSINQATASLLVLESPTVSVNSGSVCQGEPFVMTPSGANKYSFSTPFSTVINTVVGTHHYTVVGTATNGCKGEAISTLTVHGMPSTTLTAQRTTMCRNESNTLTASGALSFAWSFTTATTPVVVISPTVSGSYTVTGTTAEGCTKTASVFISVGACTGLDENSAMTLQIYPNPSNGDFVIESRVEETVVVYDLLGRDLQRIKLRTGTNAVSTDLPAGKYFIKGTQSNTFRSFVVTRN